MPTLNKTYLTLKSGYGKQKITNHHVLQISGIRTTTLAFDSAEIRSVQQLVRLVLNAVSVTLAIFRRPILVAFYDTHGDTEDTSST